MRDAVANLGEPYREVVALRFFGELSLLDIAAATGRPEGTVKAQLHRGLERLRRSLGGERGDERPARPGRTPDPRTPRAVRSLHRLAGAAARGRSRAPRRPAADPLEAMLEQYARSTDIAPRADLSRARPRRDRRGAGTDAAPPLPGGAAGR